MSEPWGKFYARAFTGSMRGAGAPVFALLSYCVANAKPPEGTLEINPEVVAFFIGEKIEVVKKALEYLQQEDKESRQKDEGGKRLLYLGGFEYQLVNWKYYREGVDDEARKAYFRKYQAERRRKAKGPPLKGEVSYLKKQKEIARQEDAEHEASEEKLESEVDSGVHEEVEKPGWVDPTDAVKKEPAHDYSPDPEEEAAKLAEERKRKYQG